MHKWIIVVVFFVLISALSAGCVPETFTNPVKVNVTLDDSITNLSIAIDSHDIKHIVGLKENRVVYLKGNINQPTHQFTMDWGLLPPGTDTSSWKQYNPEVAVLSDGTTHIVWYETRANLTKKIACHFEIPADSLPTKLHFCQRLDDVGNFTTGLVRVIAKGDTAYAVYSRVHSSGYVDSIWYKRIKDLTTTGLVVSYLNVLEEGTIYYMDLTMDSNNKLHIVYMDRTTASPNSRLYYRSDATTNLDDSMSQVWAIAFGSAGLVETVAPDITIYTDGSDFIVAITSIWEKSGLNNIYLDRCKVDGCGDKSSQSLTLGLSDWNTSPEFLELKGMGVFNAYILSFIAHNDLSDNDQVWYWNNPMAGEPTQVTDSLSAKSNLLMVDGLTPVVGYMESWQTILPLVTYNHRVSMYDETHGIREVHSRSCQVNYKGRSAAMASYVDFSAVSIPVAGLWNICGDAWFSTNAYLIDLPIILK